ncbi:hypothetical protein N4T20_05410 [Flavobacterium sp. TR2]|uniref:hypothetical protein n=1 Tax=Flavobacterium sp. TR2 TaxID=2977321 RepID=UPI0021B13C24|nr:hypothetical protein [Flavobacterium sp. TR2]UWY29373.1 hypothetical protein N4T20_05410 [Flavobacterium sp. TR2]
MGKKLTVYQTLKNKDNPEEVEMHGPYKCNWSNSWLGEGYYFWEKFLNSAHWWGEVHCANNYFICEANCIKTDENCFDLVGDTEHMDIFSNAIDIMKAEGIMDKKTTVPRVLKYLKDDLKLFKYEATRAVGYTSIGRNKSAKYIKRMLFEPTKRDKADQFIDYKPPIQICFYKQTSMGLNGYSIVFPLEYSNVDYVI